MRAVLLALAATATLAAPAAANPIVAVPPGDYVLPLPFAGGVREYRLHVPPAYDAAKPTPLLLVFHGTFGNAYNVAAQTGLDDVADENGFLAVYPEAAGIQWNDGRESTTAPPSDDVAFVSALLDHLESTLLNVDSRRIYATGMSSGGIFAYRLGVELSDRIAAIAPVAGMLPYAITGRPRRPVSLVAFHGTADNRVAFDGRTDPPAGEGPIATLTIGGPHPSVPATIARWAEFDHCTAPVVTEQLPDVEPTDGTRVTRITHGGCDAGAEVVLYRIEGGGHAWPGATDRGISPDALAESGATVSRDINASRAMWNFFAAHPMG